MLDPTSPRPCEHDQSGEREDADYRDSGRNLGDSHERHGYRQRRHGDYQRTPAPARACLTRHLSTRLVGAPVAHCRMADDRSRLRRVSHPSAVVGTCSRLCTVGGAANDVRRQRATVRHRLRIRRRGDVRDGARQPVDVARRRCRVDRRRRRHPHFRRAVRHADPVSTARKQLARDGVVETDRRVRRAHATGNRVGVRLRRRHRRRGRVRRRPGPAECVRLARAR